MFATVSLSRFYVRGDDGKIARREIQDWLDKNAGDFSEVEDFHAIIDSAVYGWQNEESELTFSACMFHEYDDEDSAMA